MVSKQLKSELVEKFGQSKTDTGSAEVQVAILTERIKGLTPHFASNKKDAHSMRGMMKLIGRRRRLLRYIAKRDYQGYQKLIKSLGIRK